MVTRSGKGASDAKGVVGIALGGQDKRTLDFLVKYESLKIYEKFIAVQDS